MLDGTLVEIEQERRINIRPLGSRTCRHKTNTIDAKMAVIDVKAATILTGVSYVLHNKSIVSVSVDAHEN